jgi:hypothetical protein
MSAAEIAARLGRARGEGRGWRTECPVHHGFSLNLADGRDGRLLVFCWGGCSAEEVLQELRRLDLHDDRWAGHEIKDRREDDAGRIHWAQGIWGRARDARRSPVAAYLRSRGITIPPPLSLRWLTSCKHGPTDSFLPAMVAKIVNSNDELIGIHRTYLLPDGSSKATVDKEHQKMSLGRIAGGVRLALFDPDRALIVGEGIETVLSLMQLRGLPGWAAVSTSGLKNLILPRAVKRVLIAVDHDVHGKGEAAAREAGQRWLLESREIRLAMPTGLGDWNDVLRGKCNA